MSEITRTEKFVYHSVGRERLSLKSLNMASTLDLMERARDCYKEVTREVRSNRFVSVMSDQDGEELMNRAGARWDDFN